MQDGYLPLSRTHFKSFLWQEARVYSRFEAYLDLYQTARHTPGTQYVENRCLSLRKGELVASVRYLAERWSWSRGKVERYLSALKKQKKPYIETRTETGITIINICNYDTYKKPKPKPETPARHAQGHPRDKEKESKLKETLSPPNPPPGGTEKEILFFSIPTIEEWHRYAATKPGYRPAETSQQYHYNTARGWQIGGKPIANWHALVDVKAAQHIPTAPPPQSLPTPPVEPAGWRDRMAQLYPQSDPTSFSWAELHQKYPDIAQQLQTKRHQA